MTDGTLTTVSKDAEELQAALERLRRCIHLALKQRSRAPRHAATSPDEDWLRAYA